MHVTSRQNPVVKRFREVARNGRIGDVVLLDGPHLLSEAIDAGLPLEVVAFTSGAAEGRLASVRARCQDAGAPVITVPDSLIDTLSPVQHASGVVALARLKGTTIDAIVGGPSPQLILLLDGVQDPGNVGAIVRVAEGCGATGVIAGPGTADPFGWKALRGSMGSAFRVPVAAASSLDAATASARRAGLRVFATQPRGGTPLSRASLAQPSAILLGGEGSGLAQPALDAADERLTIPMRPPVESLNVSIAAALVLYEAARQRAHVAV